MNSLHTHYIMLKRSKNLFGPLAYETFVNSKICTPLSTGAYNTYMCTYAILSSSPEA